eukprot:CAMPEP_0178385164 /NCGR_PEP_ID=MMETSP0689_2-20121128/7893_1 /TAXON_ID=160604 /ORGANISM="Amphidinium massartii, Strain CS-259" /LENGTH=73 /DNA_ID=CAMNT_0020005441 /DNA_START=681 /DNA_END=899 /DNA_ORIENTATION=+
MQWSKPNGTISASMSMLERSHKHIVSERRQLQKPSKFTTSGSSPLAASLPWGFLARPSLNGPGSSSTDSPTTV